MPLTPQESRERLYQLELLVDASSLPLVIEMLAVICDEKADHLRSNWQDADAAKAWASAARYLDKVTAAKVFYRIPGQPETVADRGTW